MKKTITTTEELEFLPIITPNFILVKRKRDDEEQRPIPITEFTDKELRELGQEFIENLIKKARLKP